MSLLTFTYSFFLLLSVSYVVPMKSFSYSVDHSTYINIVHSNSNSPIENAEVFDLILKKRYRTDSYGLVKIPTVHDQQIRLRIRHKEFFTIDTTFTESEQDTIKIEMYESIHFINENVVVTATRSSINKEDSPVRISTIDKKQLQQTQSITLAEGLQFQQGLRLENNCQNCGTTQIRINGLEGPYSQILIDSKPIFTTVSGVYGLEQIPTSMIKNVEILRGGASSMFGGNAVGGVINVLTKDALTNEYDISTVGTSFGNGAYEFSTQAVGSIVSDDLSKGITVYGSSRSRDPWDANGDSFSELARLSQQTIGTKVSFKPTKEFSFNGGYSFINEDRRGGNKFNLKPEESDITEWIASKSQFGTFSLEYSPSTFTTYSVYSGFSTVNRDSYYGANQDKNAYGVTNNGSFLLGTSFTSELYSEQFGDHLLTTGAEMNYEGLEDIALGYNRNIRQFVQQQGFYIQDNIHYTQYIDAIIGVRIDNHSMVNNVIINPRMSIKFNPLPSIAIRGNYSTGYRAPQAFNEDLHIQVVNGNLQIHIPGVNLREERSRSYSTSIDHTIKENNFVLTTNLEAFYTNLFDVFVYDDIGNDVNGNQIFERKNGGSSTVKGLTLDVTGSVGPTFSFRASYTLQENHYGESVVWSDKEIEISGQPKIKIQQSTNFYLRTPNQYGYFSITSTPNTEFSASLSGVYTGSMFIPWYKLEQDVLVRSKDFIDIMFKISYKPTFLKDFTISSGMFNVFNSYQEAFDIGTLRDAGFTYGPLKPRSVFLGVQWSH